MWKEMFDIVSKLLVLITIVEVALFVYKKAKAAPMTTANVTPKYDGTMPLQYNVYRL
jgi:hypothetical protein